MKRNILLIIAFILPLITISAAQLFERTASSTAVTPDGYAKVVFAINGPKTAKMFVKDANGNEYYLESNPSSQSPYFYFIPYGSYTVVRMEHIAICNTAHGCITVGSTFTSPNVGYMAMSYDATDPSVQYYKFDKILSTDTTTPTPEGCQRVVFAVPVSSTMVAEMIVQAEDGKLYKITSREPVSSGDRLPYFYFIPYGTYKVINMLNFSKCNTAAGTLTVGDTFYVGVEGHTSVGYFS